LTLSTKDIRNAINYITGATYGPDGGITGFVSGNSGTSAGINNAFTYNKRLQPVTMSATTPSQTVFSIGYDFHIGNGTSGVDNGNVYGITNYKDQNRNQTFTYDALNRLISAQNAGTNCAATVMGGKSEYWGNSYGYDAWGNLLQKSVTKCSAENLNVTVLANNRLSGYGYDAAGNMTTDPTDNVTLNYDQENRLTGAAGYTYTYDSDGNRAIKSNGSTGTLYWYMMPGVVAESDLAGTTKSEYIFFDGERAARRDGPTGADGVFYYFSDHLKTASVITDSAGVIKAESDYYPWGGELQFVANDSNHYKFTGKERDSESGLDYFGARYYSNGMGRWVSADWSAGPATVPYAHLDNPQTLNLYSYVDNNPINGIDADGHAINHEFDGLMAGLDAGPPADEGGPTQTQAALTLAAMSSPAFGWQLEVQQAQNQANENTPVGNTTTGALEKTMTNEVGSLSTPKKGNPDVLADAKDALANTLINNANLDRPAKVAPATGTASTQDAQIMKNAVTNRANGGADPVEGRTQFGTTHNPNIKSRNAMNHLKGAAGRETVYEKFGPFRDSVSRRPTWIVIYNDPGQ
jgi:RHS repeat-associated protein